MFHLADHHLPSISWFNLIHTSNDINSRYIGMCELIRSLTSRCTSKVMCRDISITIQAFNYCIIDLIQQSEPLDTRNRRNNQGSWTVQKIHQPTVLISRMPQEHIFKGTFHLTKIDHNLDSTIGRIPQAPRSQSSSNPK